MVRDSRKRKLLIWASAREVWKWKVLFSCVLALPETEALIWASAREVWKWTVLFSCVLALPEMEAPHLGVSSGGVEVEGVFAKFAGQHLGIEQPAA